MIAFLVLDWPSIINNVIEDLVHAHLIFNALAGRRGFLIFPFKGGQIERVSLCLHFVQLLLWSNTVGILGKEPCQIDSLRGWLRL